jgi:Cu(I)/Ag(I) efflux system membrane fusion protein
MFASIAFRGPTVAKSVLVPSEAVIRTGTRDVVVVADGQGRFAPVEVEVGREGGDMTELRKGLAAGQRVVASGQFLVDSEANLKGALERLTTTAPQAATQVAPPQAHKAAGVVRSVGDEVLIKHGAIPTAGMGAMTMAFKAPKGGVPKDVKEGTAVKFEFVLTPQGEMQLTSIVPADKP